MNRKRPTVIDFFCGAGGFSEGFRQQGFEIVMGIDNWLPAVETHNLNHGLKDSKRDVLDFSSSVDEIDKLPNTEVIVGSPPCVLFSLSNKGGKSDKTLGIKLIESFFRVIAVKKHQPSSKLQAWFMENVPNSKNFIKPKYTFRDLGLEDWAKAHKLNPNLVAINASINGRVLNTADFGASQKRARFVCGEITATGKFPSIDSFIKKEHRSIGTIKGKMPAPNSHISKRIYADPNYPHLKFKAQEITDHFYDSGIYEIQWKAAKYAKVNHPFMGKMSFPEDENNPSRTIMATRSSTTREALIYKSEYKRTGDGEYRLPTIREIATLMGFPYSYQFTGGEHTKWRQIGNAVSPHMSAALAKSVRISMDLKPIPDSKITFTSLKGKAAEIENLNTFAEKKFDNPPQRNRKARFRKHPFKDGNMTVALTNFNPASGFRPDAPIEWHSSIFAGSGKDFVLKVFPRRYFKKIAKFIESHGQNRGRRFLKEFDRKFADAIGKTHRFQDAYVAETIDDVFEPGKLIDDISTFISAYEPEQKYMEIPGLLPHKNKIPSKQVLAMYAINRVIS